VKPSSILLVAGEASGDQLAAELVKSLSQLCRPNPPRFFGAGGPAMAAAGVEVLVDLTSNSAIGPADALRQYSRYRRAFDLLLDEASRRIPDRVVGVDFGAFNLRFAAAIRRRSGPKGPFHNWSPKIVQFVSPQVWASRPGRALEIARNHDRRLSILPFEKNWYSHHAPQVPVRFVGHPIVDRHGHIPEVSAQDGALGRNLLLLPGSRPGELRRHWACIAGAAEILRRGTGIQPVLVLPSETALAWIPSDVPAPEGLRIRIGGLGEELRQAAVAIASTGTVTLECAWFGVPTVALYRTSWSTYQIGKRIIRVPFLALPNLLAGKAVFPEFIQEAANPAAVADAALEWLQDPDSHRRTVDELARLREALGSPGACRRAAEAILEI
jgi:lipid-A-disaccharide synthase